MPLSCLMMKSTAGCTCASPSCSSVDRMNTHASHTGLSMSSSSLHVVVTGAHPRCGGSAKQQCKRVLRCAAKRRSVATVQRGMRAYAHHVQETERAALDDLTHVQQKQARAQKVRSHSKAHRRRAVTEAQTRDEQAHVASRKHVRKMSFTRLAFPTSRTRTKS
jgi:hypothetical protein